MDEETHKPVNRHWLWLAVAVIVVDQLTKWWAVSALELHRPVPIAPFLNFTLTYNPGAAFSFLSQAGGWQRWFFTGLSLAVSAFLIGWLWRLKAEETPVAVGLTLVIGGAIGNVIDRIYIGAVVDFVDVYYRSWSWPAFNVADSAITVGAVLLVGTMILAERSSR